MPWPWLILAIVYGACVGSFLNVVIWRLPRNESLWHPGSHCPKCGHALAWFDNVPVLAWVWLRGRCRHCRAPISIQYPIIEALTAILFGGFCALVFYTNLRPDFADLGLRYTWPALLAHLALLAGLLAATVIDARLFIIPLGIPWTVSLLAVLSMVGGTWLQPTAIGATPVVRDPAWWGAIAGGILGLAVANVLLWLGWLPRSFNEEPGSPPTKGNHALRLPAEAEEERGRDAVPRGTGTAPGKIPGAGKLSEGPEQWLAHPHPRREVLKECLFIAWPVVGALLGGLYQVPDGKYPAALHVLMGVLLGFLVGGALVWGTRIVGTLAFGKEAMGLGDVHLMAAIGAVLGVKTTVLAFFIAPFLGLGYALIAQFLGQLRHGEARVIPYGPYLAGGAVVAMIWQKPILWLIGWT